MITKCKKYPIKIIVWQTGKSYDATIYTQDYFNATLMPSGIDHKNIIFETKDETLLA